MKEYGKMYVPNEVKDLYPAISAVYQQAFSGEPWFEVTKCEDQNTPQGCVGGFSNLNLNQFCEVCKVLTTKPAYETDELIKKFDYLSKTRPTRWYLEKENGEITMAAVAWKAVPFTIFTERYADVPEMKSWLNSQYWGNDIVWLDEVFADKSKCPSGNLKNFRGMCQAFAQDLNCDTLAFRTINPRMITAVKNNFPDKLNQVTGRGEIYRANIDVPDRRDFVIVSRMLPRDGGCML